jgi:hypothetical protein
MRDEGHVAPAAAPAVFIPPYAHSYSPALTLCSFVPPCILRTCLCSATVPPCAHLYPPRSLCVRSDAPSLPPTHVHPPCTCWYCTHSPHTLLLLLLLLLLLVVVVVLMVLVLVLPLLLLPLVLPTWLCACLCWSLLPNCAHLCSFCLYQLFLSRLIIYIIKVSFSIMMCTNFVFE